MEFDKCKECNKRAVIEIPNQLNDSYTDVCLNCGCYITKGQLDKEIIEEYKEQYEEEFEILKERGIIEISINLDDFINEQNEHYKTIIETINKEQTEDQKVVIEDFQIGTKLFFINNLLRVCKGVIKEITNTTIYETLKIMFYEVEGDLSQLETEHKKYAKNNQW